MNKVIRVTIGSKRRPAAISIRDGKVVAAGTPLKPCIGLTESQFRTRARLKAWVIDEVPLHGSVQSALIQTQGGVNNG